MSQNVWCRIWQQLYEICNMQVFVCRHMYENLCSCGSTACQGDAMMNPKLCRTFQSSVMHKTASVTKMGRKLSVTVSSIELGQSMRSFAVHSSQYCNSCGDGSQKHFSGNLIAFPEVKNFENWLRFCNVIPTINVKNLFDLLLSIRVMTDDLH